MDVESLMDDDDLDIVGDPSSHRKRLLDSRDQTTGQEPPLERPRQGSYSTPSILNSIFANSPFANLRHRSSSSARAVDVDDINKSIEKFIEQSKIDFGKFLQTSRSMAITCEILQDGILNKTPPKDLPPRLEHGNPFSKHFKDAEDYWESEQRLYIEFLEQAQKNRHEYALQKTTAYIAEQRNKFSFPQLEKQLDDLVQPTRNQAQLLPVLQQANENLRLCLADVEDFYKTRFAELDEKYKKTHSKKPTVTQEVQEMFRTDDIDDDPCDIRSPNEFLNFTKRHTNDLNNLKQQMKTLEKSIADLCADLKRSNKTTTSSSSNTKKSDDKSKSTVTYQTSKNKSTSKPKQTQSVGNQDKQSSGNTNTTSNKSSGAKKSYRTVVETEKSSSNNGQSKDDNDWKTVGPKHKLSFKPPLGNDKGRNQQQPRR